jgi:tRNA (cmo5U34)-methyltransferase
MSKFEKSRWADSDFSQNYRNEADIFLPFRHQFIQVTKSLYEYFIDSNIEAKILDLGCGDGLFIQELLKTFTPANVTLVDGSFEMLKAAKKRLGNNPNISFIESSFQDVLAGKSLPEGFDFIHSSLAIHHLTLDEKKKLFAYIHELLYQGGCFINYDVVVPPSEKIENWYLAIWKKWIEGHPDKGGSKASLNIPEQYKENPDNTPDTLKSQLEALEEIGFNDVDCYFKFGIFSLFGGFK